MGATAREQVGFDVDRETRIVGMILKNLSSLFGQTVESVRQLNRLRKSLFTG